MAFVCTLTETLDVACTFGLRSGMVSAQVGCDDAANVSYAIAAGLDENPGEIEFWFHLVEIDHDACTETPHWNGKKIAQIIPRDDKPRVLQALLSITKVLIENIDPKPDSIIMCTMEPDLPDKAIEKHEQVGKVFHDAGYEVHRMDPYHGQRLWLMERRG